jgi:hypothetical protein
MNDKKVIFWFLTFLFLLLVGVAVVAGMGDKKDPKDYQSLKDFTEWLQKVEAKWGSYLKWFENYEEKQKYLEAKELFEHSI